MLAIVMDRTDRANPLTWIEIGSVAGPTAAIPSAALRAARLQIVGSGQGSVSTREILAELPALAEQITNGALDIDARPVPLADVEQAWADSAATSQRIVLVPNPRFQPHQAASGAPRRGGDAAPGRGRGAGEGARRRARTVHRADRGAAYFSSASARRSTSSLTLPDLGSPRLASRSLSSALVRPS